MDSIPAKVEVVENVTPERFKNEIYPANKPVLLKGLIADWPAVRQSKQSDEALVRYIKQFDLGKPVETVMGDPEIEGKFFYTDNMDGLNFGRQPRLMNESMQQILELRGTENPPSIYIQSNPITEFLPGFEQENKINLGDASASPRIWIGNRLTVQTHFDLKENIACLVSGKRRFTLFPPEQTPNLYPGPFELTLSGPPVSMVKLDNPDFDRYPKYSEALKHQLVADLEPGDAIYIPYFWWHHVESTKGFNVLVNYWWNDTEASVGTPFDVLLHGLLTIRDLPQRQRDAWRTMFDTYVFGQHGDPLEHLPPETHGSLGMHNAKSKQHIRMILLGLLSRQAGIRLPGK